MKKRANKYYVVFQKQNGLWHQIAYFHSKLAAEMTKKNIPGTKIVRTFPSGHNYRVIREG